MHARKTGALIRAAVTIGAIAGRRATIATIAAIDDYARDLGLAFQIVDDVLDVEGSAEALGKTAGKDAAAGKPTYPVALRRRRRRARWPPTCVDAREGRARGRGPRRPARGDRRAGVWTTDSD